MQKNMQKNRPNSLLHFTFENDNGHPGKEGRQEKPAGWRKREDEGLLKNVYFSHPGLMDLLFKD